MKRYEALLQNDATHAVPVPSGRQPAANNVGLKNRKPTGAVTAAGDHLLNQPTASMAFESIVESTPRPVSRLASQSTVGSSNVTVERPKAFYITKRLNERLDEAVRYYQEVHGIRKVDRSAVVNAMLDNDTNWTDESLDLLIGRVMGLLTSRLTD